ncbi:MAG: FAD-binding oxidoreductase [Candidatus Helarchaeota archaeon]
MADEAVYEQIYEKYKSIVGSEHVSNEGPVLIAYERDQHWPFVTPTRPALVVQPQTTEQVQEIVKIANQSKIPIVPLSRGVNVRGLCVPAKPGSIVVDLRLMNHILDINPQMMTATIEPGVTHGQLQIAAREKGCRICIPGAPATGSILANYLLRGVYHTNAGDGIDHALSAEFVLPNGELLKVGAAAFPNSTPHWRYTCSPDLLGLFQSMPGSMGICTKMTVKLYPLPEHEIWFMLGYDTIEDAISIIPPLMRAQIPSVCWILPQYTLIKLIAKKTKELEKLRGSFPEFTVPITIEGPKEIVEAKAKVAMEIISKIKLPKAKLKPVPPPINFIKEFKYPRNILGFLRAGSYHALAFWGPLNKYPEYLEMMKKNGENAGYDRKHVDLLAAPVAGFWGQSCYYEAEVPYTSAQEESVEMVKKFHYATLKDLIKIGIYGWFRPFLNPMKLVMDDLGIYGKLWQDIMKLIDPNEIMNPGKVFPYEKELTW